MPGQQDPAIARVRRAPLADAAADAESSAPAFREAIVGEGIRTPLALAEALRADGSLQRGDLGHDRLIVELMDRAVVVARDGHVVPAEPAGLLPHEPCAIQSIHARLPTRLR